MKKFKIFVEDMNPQASAAAAKKEFGTAESSGQGLSPGSLGKPAGPNVHNVYDAERLKKQREEKMKR